MMTGIARNVLHIAQPATPEGASDDCASAGRSKTLSVAIVQGTLRNLVCMAIRKTLSQRVAWAQLFIKIFLSRSTQTRMSVLREGEGHDVIAKWWSAWNAMPSGRHHYVLLAIGPQKRHRRGSRAGGQFTFPPFLSCHHVERANRLIARTAHEVQSPCGHD